MTRQRRAAADRAGGWDILHGNLRDASTDTLSPQKRRDAHEFTSCASRWRTLRATHAGWGGPGASYAALGGATLSAWVRRDVVIFSIMSLASPKSMAVLSL